MVKNPPANAGDTREKVLIPGEGTGNPPQYSCLENYMDRGAWRATVHGVTKSRTRLSNWAHTYTINKDDHIAQGFYSVFCNNP